MRRSSSSGRSCLTLLDYVFILRPTVIVGMWVFFLAGAGLAARRAGLPFPLSHPTLDVLLGLASMTAALGGGCLLNQLVDIETDRVNDKLFFLPRKLVSVRAARIELALVWLAAVGLSIPLSWPFRWALLAALFLNITYSAPPVRAKARAPGDLLWNGLGFGLVSAAAGWASVNPLAFDVLSVGLVYALAVCGVTASTTILDIDGDRALGLRTTAAVVGSRAASLLTIVFVAAAALAGAALRDELGFYGPALSLPLLVRAHVTRRRSDRILANQAMVAVFAVVAGVRVPYLVALLAAVYFATRAYYRARFDMSYPGIGTP